RTREHREGGLHLSGIEVAHLAHPPQEQLQVEGRLARRVAGLEARDELMDGHRLWGRGAVPEGVPGALARARAVYHSCRGMRPAVSIGPIALDATLWDEPTTGIGLYTHCLARELAGLGVEVRRLGAERSGEAPRGPRGRTRWVLAELPGL